MSEHETSGAAEGARCPLCGDVLEGEVCANPRCAFIPCPVCGGTGDWDASEGAPCDHVAYSEIDGMPNTGEVRFPTARALANEPSAEDVARAFGDQDVVGILRMAMPDGISSGWLDNEALLKSAARPGVDRILRSDCLVDSMAGSGDYLVVYSSDVAGFRVRAGELCQRLSAGLARLAED